MTTQTQHTVGSLRAQLEQLNISVASLLKLTETDNNLLTLESTMNELACYTTEVTIALSHLTAQARNEKQKMWKETQDKMSTECEKANTKISFNIGGQNFDVSKATLLTHKDTYFTAMLSSGQWKPDANGQYFIDRSPAYFEVILNYLRTGKISKKYLKGTKWEALQQELDYFQIPLPDEVKPNKSGNSTSQKNTDTSSNITPQVAAAIALFDYEGYAPDDLSFKQGDIIVIWRKLPLNGPGMGWWEGELKGRRGFVPSNYVQELFTAPQEVHKK